jgi:alpha-glucosidase (family GH31 glycosyl hydrolase)
VPGRCERRALLAASVAVIAGLAAPSASGQEPAAGSGALEAHVSEDPWALTLTDRHGAAVLAEHDGTGSGPTGTVGFRTPLGWSHATHVLSGERRGQGYVAELATTDPLRTVELALRPAGPGVIAMRASLVGPSQGVEAMGIGFDAATAERYLGFGERSNQVDQDGQVVESYVADGPYQDVEYPFLAGFVPPWGLRDQRRDATYFPVPWLLSSEGYGVLVDNAHTSRFRLRSESPDGWSVEVARAPDGEEGGELAPAPTTLRLRFFAGPKPAAVLRRFTRETGRQPAAAAPWVYGPWFQPGDDAADLQALREADAPLSAIQTYTHYLPCGDQVTASERARTTAAHEAGVAITTYFNPMVCTNYPDAYGPAQTAGALTENQAGEPYVYRYGADVDDLFVVSQYDFFEQAVRNLYATRLQEAIADGYDGWMEDFGEYTPLDSVSAGEMPGTRAHNPYARRYHCAAYDAVRDGPRPIVRFQRSGWSRTAPCAQVVWGGDPTTGWGFDGLRSAVTQALSVGASGIGIWGSDIGGFFALGDNELTPELLMRWVQLGAVSPVMRTQRNGVAVPPRSRPQVTDPDQIANWRRYAKLHTQLYPYLRAAERTYRKRGLPPMRHLALAYPGDATAAAQDDQFLFGPDILAAPVLEPGAEERDLYLPQGRWIDFWRSAGFDEQGSGGFLLDRAETLAGSQHVTVPAPLEELPLLVRAGAVLPMLAPGVDTLASYGNGSDEMTSLGERRRRLELLAFPRGSSHSRFRRRGKLTSAELDDAWKLRVSGSRRHRLSLQAALSTMRNPVQPCRVELNGDPLAGRDWGFDPATEVLTAEFAARRATLVARECA